MGSVYLRVGFAGDAAPRFAIPLEHFFRRGTAGWAAYRVLRNCAPVGPSPPVPAADFRRHWLVVLTAVFVDHLFVAPKECKVLVVEQLHTPSAVRNGLITALLHDLRVPAVSMQPGVLLPVLASGGDSGVVVDVGETECRAVAVAHGRPVLQSYVTVPVGVRTARTRFRRQLASEATAAAAHHVLSADVDGHAFRGLFDAAVGALPPAAPADLAFPSGWRGVCTEPLTVPGSLRTACVGGLVDGSAAAAPDGGGGAYDADSDADADADADGAPYDEVGGAAGALLETLRRCARDVRACAARRVIFAGGGAAIAGMANAVCAAAARRAERDPRYADLCACPLRPAPATAFSPADLAWVGGSLFASVKANEAKFVRLQDLGHVAPAPPSPVPAEAAPLLATAHKLGLTDVLAAPDWLSVHEKDWAFFAPVPNATPPPALQT